MFLMGKDYLAQHRDPLLWVVQDLIPLSGKANLFGKPKAGKSFWALQLASAVSSGQSHFMGFPVHKSGPVAYIQIDTTASVWFDRVKDQAALELPFDNVAFADTETPGMVFPFNVTEHAPVLKAALADIKPVLVIWDTIREAHRAEENESTAMQAVISQMLACTRGEGWAAANLWLSHRKKENPNYEDDLMNANRGSSYLAGTCDSVIQLSTPHEKTGKATMEFQSRTHPKEKRASIFDVNTCIWRLDDDEQLLMQAVATVQDLKMSDRGQARELAKLLNPKFERLDEPEQKKEIENARGLLRRRKRAKK